MKIKLLKDVPTIGKKDDIIELPKGSLYFALTTRPEKYATDYIEENDKIESTIVDVTEAIKVEVKTEKKKKVSK